MSILFYCLPFFFLFFFLFFSCLILFRRSTDAQVIQRGNRSAGYGFVTFASLEAANKAVAALNQKEFEGRTLIVEIAKPTEQKDKERSERRAK
ncbi:MAG TPA: hypothetical protein VGO47_13950, partial [Chlamydiales bacterium]|nr:hypothetical protein [Chlamydiales bacterium]